jgi:hypothetical protein
VREADGSLKLNSFAFYLHNETFKTCTLVHFPTESSILDALGSAITYFRMNILDKEVSAPSRVS